MTSQYEHGPNQPSFEEYIASRDADIASLRKALKRAADMLQSIAGDIEDGYSLSDLRGKYVMAVLGARDNALDALASTPSPDEKPAPAGAGASPLDAPSA